MATHPILTVYYDEWCPLCRGIRSRLERLDWLGRLTYASTRAPGVVATLGVTAEALERQMHVRDLRSGRVLAGIDAVGAITAQLPLLMPLWPLIRLSAALGFGGWAYAFIASRRAVVPTGGCEHGECRLPEQP